MILVVDFYVLKILEYHDLKINRNHGNTTTNILKNESNLYSSQSKRETNIETSGRLIM